ncbi:ABC transporter ATP-binding protein [Serratia fonticola]|uniref:ABC transporter ATP-binding protein n=1 Tax=Serratia fonticola TaxID=47917 RepID=UPI0003AC7878|nr:ABC transporter ATP-binding protein [Serratia fonticola]ERK14218.1 putative ECF transporter [Serratia fonticola AU-P3(3)]MEB7884727.1 ABC transporter ATP-binding protein [Serratia fonticola]
MGDIVLEQVSVTFPGAGTPALDRVCLRIRQGECVLLTGQCGCGKSTLLRLINGIVPHVIPGGIEGRISINGMHPAAEKLYRLGRRVATVYQNPRRQFFCADPLGELVFGSENAGQEPEAILVRAAGIARRLKIEHLLARNMFTLSGGELQRIAIGSALMDQPSILLLDEPASNLDTHSIRTLAQILQSLRSIGMTIIIAEHRLWFLQGIVDRVVRLSQGRIVEDLPARQFWQRDDALRMQQGLRALTTPQAASLAEAPVGSDGIVYQHPAKGRMYFPRGCITVLSGDNGVGKSTLARTLAGLENARDEILLDGKPFPLRQRLRRSFLVMQDVNRQLFAASVMQELQMGRHCVSAQSLDKTINDMGLAGLLDVHPMALSGGQQQHVAMALALLEPREVFIFDEPTSGLDYAGLLRVVSRLKQLASTGAVVILITHDEELSTLCADFQIVMCRALSSEVLLL